MDLLQLNEDSNMNTDQNNNNNNTNIKQNNNDNSTILTEIDFIEENN